MAKKAAKTEAEAATSTKNAPDHARAPKSPNGTEAKTATETEAKTVIETEIESATGTAKSAAEAETATGERAEVEPGLARDPEVEGETTAEKDTEPDLDRENDARKPLPNARKPPSSHPKTEIRGLCFVCNSQRALGPAIWRIFSALLEKYATFV